MISQDVKPKDSCSPSGETRSLPAQTAGAVGVREGREVNPAEQFRLFLRPDAALFHSPPRSWWGRWRYRKADRSLVNILDIADSTPNESGALVARCLAWQYRWVLSVYQGQADVPQQAAETLRTMEGDCEDGAILLMCLCLTVLPVAEWSRLSLVVGSFGGWHDHCWLMWRTMDSGLVALDPQKSDAPIGSGMWRIDGEVTP